MRHGKSITCLILVIILVVLSCACSDNSPKGPVKFDDVYFDSFDTVIQLIAYTENEEEFAELSKEVHNLYIYYHQLFDIYDDYEGLNNVKTINDNAGKNAVKVPDELMDLLDFGVSMYGSTDGNVNIAFGAVLKLWHEARDAASVSPERAYLPDEDLLKEAALHCSIDDIVLDRENGTVFLKDPRMSLDLGAIAKGYATELIAGRLEAEGYDNVLISAGGNTRSIGTKPDGSSWVIAIQDPNKADSGFIETLAVSNTSVVTSGTYERYFEFNGERYHHIINKDSLKPENKYLSVTIVTKDSGLADALSTAVFNMDAEEGLAFVESLEDAEAMWVTGDGSLVYSEGFRELIK